MKNIMPTMLKAVLMRGLTPAKLLSLSAQGLIESISFITVIILNNLHRVNVHDAKVMPWLGKKQAQLN